MGQIQQRLDNVRERIRQAERQCSRQAGDVRLIAVSKTKPAAMIREAAEAGQQDFGESYLQEALAKQEELADLELCWHFIGPIQSNKTRPIAEHFDWVHSVDRVKIARRLANQRPAQCGDLNVCLQVNIDQESTKSGFAPGEVAEGLEEIAALPGLRVRGLMAIPRRRDNPAGQREAFARVRELLEAANERGHQLDTLSMGMSHDLEAAVAEGATMIRVGTAIFGARE